MYVPASPNMPEDAPFGLVAQPPPGTKDLTSLVNIPLDPNLVSVPNLPEFSEDLRGAVLNELG